MKTKAKVTYEKPDFVTIASSETWANALHKLKNLVSALISSDEVRLFDDSFHSSLLEDEKALERLTTWDKNVIYTCDQITEKVQRILDFEFSSALSHVKIEIVTCLIEIQRALNPNRQMAIATKKGETSEVIYLLTERRKELSEKFIKKWEFYIRCLARWDEKTKLLRKLWI